MRRGLSFLVMAAIVACGCGGGGGSAGSAPAPPGVQHFAYGIVAADAIGNPLPQVVTNGSYGAVVTGVAGAAFTNISVSPAHSIASTQIAFSRFGALYTMNSDGSNVQEVPGIATNFANFMYPSWSRDGRLVFGEIAGSWVIEMCDRDGSNLHRVYPGSAFNEYRPQWSPDNTRIAFTRINDPVGHFQIYVSWSDGTGVKRLSDGTADDDYPTWSTDSKTIYFTRNNGSNQYIYSMPSIGGPATLFDNSQSDEVSLVVSPDNTRLAYGFYLSSSEGLSEDFFSGGGFGFSNNNIYDQPLTFSPDGRSVLYLNVQNGVATIESADPRFNNPTPLLTYNDGELGDAAWEPFMGTVNMVSATGTPMIGHAASGFLFGQFGKRVTSFATFTARTPTTATLTADPISGTASNIIYHLGGDALTNISYVNTIASVPTTLLNATATAKGAVLSFDASDGTVASVLPYSKERPHGTARPDGSISYSGEFLGVFVKGKNLAPGGAKMVRLSAKTGRVLEVR